MTFYGITTIRITVYGKMRYIRSSETVISEMAVSEMGMKGILMRLFMERFITLFIVALRNFFAGISLSRRYVASSGIIPESILRGGQHCKMRIETTGNGNT